MASDAANQGTCMSERQIFIFGAGYSGKAFARANKDAATILGTTRSPEKFEALGIPPSGEGGSPDLILRP